jgi:hypothetical protein
MFVTIGADVRAEDAAGVATHRNPAVIESGWHFTATLSLSW